jgi:hypothetical protein
VINYNYRYYKKITWQDISDMQMLLHIAILDLSVVATLVNFVQKGLGSAAVNNRRSYT